MDVASLDGKTLSVNYYPSPAQLAFHQDRGKFKERLLQAGTGGGKTYASAYEVTDITFREPAGVGIIAGPDYPQLEASVYQTFKLLFGRDIRRLEPFAKFNQQRKTLTWWNGWEWRFATMDDPTSVEGIPNATFVWLNEARLVRDFDGPDGAWLNLTRRLRGPDSRPRYAIADTHSPTRGIVSIFKPGPVPPKRYRAGNGSYVIQDCADPERRTYQWSTRGAMAWKTLSEGDGARIIAQYHGSAAKRIIEGEYARPGGLVFDAFEPSRNVRKMPLGVTIDRMSYGCDWGWTHPTVLTAHAWIGDVVHTIAEWSRHKVSDKDILEQLRLWRTRWGSGTVWCGADRPEGINALRHPPSEFRMDGVDARAYKGKVEDGVAVLNGRAGAGSWLVDPDCREVLRSLDEWERDRDTGQVKKQDGADDAPDSARYGIVGESQRSTPNVWFPGMDDDPQPL